MTLVYIKAFDGSGPALVRDALYPEVVVIVLI